jgi:hypothetical protein
MKQFLELAVKLAEGPAVSESAGPSSERPGGWMNQSPTYYWNKLQQMTLGQPGIFPKWMTGAAPQAALFAGGGALAGRYLAPLLYRMMPRSMTGAFAGIENTPDFQGRLNTAGSILGGGAGLLAAAPGLYNTYMSGKREGKPFSGVQSLFFGGDNVLAKGSPEYHKNELDKIRNTQAHKTYRANNLPETLPGKQTNLLLPNTAIARTSVLPKPIPAQTSAQPKIAIASVQEKCAYFNGQNSSPTEAWYRPQIAPSPMQNSIQEAVFRGTMDPVAGMQYNQALRNAGQGRGLISPQMLTKALTEVTQFSTGAIVGGLLGTALSKFAPGDQMNLARTGALLGGMSNALMS